MKQSMIVLAVATLASLLNCTTANKAFASYPACDFLPDYRNYPTDGISQLVFKTNETTNTVTAIDRPDQPNSASYILQVDKASADMASFILIVKGANPEGSTIFRTIFYTSQGYPDTYAHKVKNSTPCSVKILRPANTEGSLAMNVITFGA